MCASGGRITANEVDRQVVYLMGMEIIASGVTCVIVIEAVVEPEIISATTMTTVTTVGNAIAMTRTLLHFRLEVGVAIPGILTIIVTARLTTAHLHVATTVVDTVVDVAARVLATMWRRQDIAESAQAADQS
ncbi:hypothetical protein PI124_g19160 [Phytophthora idaei]|nr:hypothetical protein PI125_g20121 [Phytophthora idaei]KAG3134823.1 hypothetical protein PI126_g18529 [Phytophthora idaei]KAG3235814.1 hypothetical protein PI124_g19160 [Phytophthora idaei]